MAKKQFKAESKKLLDLMIHSIYTNKEIFLRELISNASDAIDKLYYRSLTDETVKLNRGDFLIRLDVDRAAGTLAIQDNGWGMTQEELESNLGVIAKSGSLAFKADMEKKEDIDIIGQFGVGFYSAFMVSDKVRVETKAYGQEQAWRWESQGADGYTIEPCQKESHGTTITLFLKEDTETEKYREFLDQYRISGIVKKYSDYIAYPIQMEMEQQRLKDPEKHEFETFKEVQTLNSMVPLWRKNKNEIKPEEYNAFYHEKFYDFTDPARVIHSKTEGLVSYDTLLFIPKQAPFNYYAKDYEKGLQLYSNGVMIMEKCPDLLSDHFSFVKGLVDSADLSLNISREMLQQDHQLKLIAKNIEKKIQSELEKMLKEDRDTYEEFFAAFGPQLKFGAYDHYGAHKDQLQDLLLFRSSSQDKPVTLKEYTERMPEDQEKIFYAAGETPEKIELLPQVESVKAKGYEILYLTESIDEFVLRTFGAYDGKAFANVCAQQLDLDTEEEKNALQKENENAKDLLAYMKEALGDSVLEVRFTNKLKNYPACLSSEGDLSVEMEKTLNAMSLGHEDEKVKAKLILEISADHPIAGKLKALYETDKDSVSRYAKILYGQACLIGGMNLENPAEFSEMICGLMV